MYVCLSVTLETLELSSHLRSCMYRSHVSIYHQNNPENKASCSYLGFSKLGSTLRLNGTKTTHMKYTKWLGKEQQAQACHSSSTPDSGLNNEMSMKQSPPSQQSSYQSINPVYSYKSTLLSLPSCSRHGYSRFHLNSIRSNQTGIWSI